MITREKLAEEYLDRINNYLTDEKWGEHRGLRPEEARAFLTVCKTCFEVCHPES